MSAFQKYSVRTVKWLLKYEKSYTCAVDNAGVQATEVPSREELGTLKITTMNENFMDTYLISLILKKPSVERKTGQTITKSLLIHSEWYCNSEYKGTVKLRYRNIE